MIPDASFLVYADTPPKAGDVLAVNPIGSDERVEMVVLQVKVVSSAGQQHAPTVPAYRVFCSEVEE